MSNSIGDIRDRIYNDITTTLEVPNNYLSVSFIKVLSTVLAGMFKLLYISIDMLSKDLFIETCSDEVLLNKYAPRYRVERKQSTVAKGSAVVSGSDGVIIPGGTVLVYNSVEYLVSSEVTVIKGDVTIALKSSEVGTVNNTNIAITLEFKTPIAGVNSSAYSEYGITGATDTESISSFRSRIELKAGTILNIPDSSSYRFLVENGLSFVRRAYVMPVHDGEGTFAMTVITSNLDNPVPSSSELEDMSELVNKTLPPYVVFRSISPVIVNFNFKVQLLSDSSSSRTQIEQRLEQLTLNYAEPNAVLSLNEFKLEVQKLGGFITEFNFGGVVVTGDTYTILNDNVGYYRGVEYV